LSKIAQPFSSMQSSFTDARRLSPPPWANRGYRAPSYPIPQRPCHGPNAFYKNQDSW